MSVLAVSLIVSPAYGATAGLEVQEETTFCPPPNPALEAALNGMTSTLLTPGAKIDFRAFAASAEAIEARKLEEQQKATDWANICFYKREDSKIQSGVSAVFVGDSITFNWARSGASFDSSWIGRGISGQTTPQILVRFQSDVIDLHPKVVHIMAGTNDVAGNTGPTTDRDIENNIKSMTTLAQANGIRVILATIPPTAHFAWAPNVIPAARIKRLNTWIEFYAAKVGATFANYYPALADDSGNLRSDLGNDGVHPNRLGYLAGLCTIR